MRTILVTGANGFVGAALCDTLIEHDYDVRGAFRKKNSIINSIISNVIVGDINSKTDWSAALKSVDVVIHLAARVHVMDDISKDPLDDFRKINVIGTLNIARQAAENGVVRFIYLSSIKVNGEAIKSELPFTENDEYVPTDPYALSKYETEQGLLQLAKKTQMDVVIIRPPLVYGPGVKANFLSMMKWLEKEIPLPFGSIHNKRSLVALDNLVDLILTCINHPAAANEVFLVSDGEDLSTTDLLSRVATALGKKSRLIPINQQLLEIALKLIGKKDLGQRLCGSLQVDISKAKKLLNWVPPVSVDEGLHKTAKYFLESKSV